MFPGSEAVCVLTDIVDTCCLMSKMAATEKERRRALAGAREEQSLPGDHRGASWRCDVL